MICFTQKPCLELSNFYEYHIYFAICFFVVSAELLRVKCVNSGPDDDDGIYMEVLGSAMTTDHHPRCVPTSTRPGALSMRDTVVFRLYLHCRLTVQDDHRGDDKHRDYAHTEPNGHSDAANGNGTSNGGHRDDASESPRRSHR